MLRALRLAVAILRNRRAAALVEALRRDPALLDIAEWVEDSPVVKAALLRLSGDVVLAAHAVRVGEAVQEAAEGARSFPETQRVNETAQALVSAIRRREGRR